MLLTPLLAISLFIATFFILATAVGDVRRALIFTMKEGMKN
jgi:hypothetical protein